MLEIERLPSYLSPSALMQSKNQPNTFYMTRLINNRMEREPQSLAASVGSAFDYYVKLDLINKFPHKAHFMQELKNGIEDNNVEAHQAGKLAFERYDMGAFKRDEICDIEVHTNKTVNGVPLFGKLDATYFDDDFTWDKGCPLDWKVSGYTSKKGVSPYPRYHRIWEDFKPKGAHKLYEKDIPFHLIDETWATQLCTYGWLLGIPLGKPFPARIEMLCWGRGSQNAKMRTAKYRGIITEEFQLGLIAQYESLWNSLLDGSFVLRLESSEEEEFVWQAAINETWF